MPPHQGHCQGGADGGFSPFALLEASLAACMNMTLRVYAQAHNIVMDAVETTVTIKQGKNGATITYGVKLPDNLTAEQKAVACGLEGMSRT